MATNNSPPPTINVIAGSNTTVQDNSASNLQQKRSSAGSVKLAGSGANVAASPRGSKHRGSANSGLDEKGSSKMISQHGSAASNLGSKTGSKLGSAIGSKTASRTSNQSNVFYGLGGSTTSAKGSTTGGAPATPRGSAAGQTAPTRPPKVTTLPPFPTTEESRLYGEERQINRLMQCIVAGLIIERPENHLGYIDRALHAIQINGGVEALTWDLLIRRVHPLSIPEYRPKPPPVKRPSAEDVIDPCAEQKGGETTIEADELAAKLNEQQAGEEDEEEEEDAEEEEAVDGVEPVPNESVDGIQQSSRHSSKNSTRSSPKSGSPKGGSRRSTPRGSLKGISKTRSPASGTPLHGTPEGTPTSSEHGIPPPRPGWLPFSHVDYFRQRLELIPTLPFTDVDYFTQLELDNPDDDGEGQGRSVRQTAMFPLR